MKLNKSITGLITITILLTMPYAITQAQTPAWTQLSPNTSIPTTRCGHTSFYDPTINRITIFGGLNSGFDLLNDVWILSTANGVGGTPAWTQIAPSGTPPAPRFFHTAVYDSNNNKMIVFGGIISTTTTVCINDVWVLTGANWQGSTPTWTQLFPTGSAPTTRDSHTAVYDEMHNRMIIFGGSPDLGNTFLNDTWVLSNANGVDSTPPAWTQLTTSGSIPTPRQGHSAVFDKDHDRMIIFGGYGTDGGRTNEVWALSYANGVGGTPTWNQLSTTGNVGPILEDHTAVYDTTNNRMIIFGGYSSETQYSDDVWVLSTANGLGGTPAWSRVFPTGSAPTTRANHTAIYDSTNNRMVIFGGSPDLSFPDVSVLNDLWVLSDANNVPVEDWMLYATESDNCHSVRLK